MRRASTSASSAPTSGSATPAAANAPAASVGWISNGASAASHPTKAATTRLPRTSISPSCLDDLARRRLGDEQERVGAVVGGEHPHRLAEHQSAHVARQVTAADADDLGDADVSTVEQAGRLLRSRAGRGDDPDGARAHDVGEPEPDLAEHRGAAPRAHDQQTELDSAALERDLVGLGHVVGEEEDVQALGERAVRLEGGVLAGDRDQRHIGVREPAAGEPERAGRRGDGAVVRAVAGAASSRSAASSADSGPSTAITTSVGPASQVDAQRRERLEVRGRAHRHLGAAVARAAPSPPSSAARCRRSGCGRPGPPSSCRHHSFGHHRWAEIVGHDPRAVLARDRGDEPVGAGDHRAPARGLLDEPRRRLHLRAHAPDREVAVGEPAARRRTRSAARARAPSASRSPATPAARRSAARGRRRRSRPRGTRSSGPCRSRPRRP